MKNKIKNFGKKAWLTISFVGTIILLGVILIVSHLKPRKNGV